jgi:pimeloyl-ACP methyl ester carboxylesterase
MSPDSGTAIDGTAVAEVAVTTDELVFRGQPLLVRRAGEGPAIGFLHGMVGTPPSHPILAAIAASGREVVAPCLPGFSGSTPCDDLRSIYDWVAATSEVVDLCGLRGQPVVASSIGAMLALELASVRPQAFSQLVLIAPLGLWDDADPVTDPFATTLSVQRRLLTADPAATAAFFDDPDGLEPEAAVEAGVVRYHTRTAAASLVWPIPDHGLRSRIHRVSTPVTLVWGAEDALAPVSYLDRFAQLIPSVTGTHVIDGAGHLAAWDEPAAIAALVSTLS